MDIHFDWQACDSRVKICGSPARRLDFALQGLKKTLEFYDFQSSESYQGDIHSSSFFLFSMLQCQSAGGNAEATDCNKAAL